jgi:hypothetical protein
VKGIQTESEKESKSDKTEGWYANFAMIVKSHGGQIDLPSATKAAQNITKKAQEKGPPYILWNSWSEELEYLDIKKGISTSFTREKGRDISGEFEVNPAALTEARMRGLSWEIPVGELNNPETSHPPIADASEAASSLSRPPSPSTSAAPSPSPSTSAAPSTPTAALQTATIKVEPTSPSAKRPREEPVPAVGPPLKVAGHEGNMPPPSVVPAETKKKTKTPLEKLHAEVFGLSKKCVSLVTQAAAICEQTQKDDSDWSWAKNESQLLQQAVTSCTDVVKMATHEVLTKKLFKLIADFKNDEQSTIKCLSDIKGKVQSSIDTVTVFLVPLTKMHTSKFMPVAKAKPRSTATM